MTDVDGTCPTPCDADCPSYCHAAHEVRAKRDHDPDDCPGILGAIWVDYED